MNSSEDDVGESNDDRQETFQQNKPKKLRGSSKVVMQR
jgi:hypothetical protein